MTARTFDNALVLIYGAILSPGKRTIASALRVMGYDHDPNPGKYNRVLSQAKWSAMVCSRLLLGLLIQAFVAVGASLVVVVDETLERRAGKTIIYKGWFRDAVRSVGNKIAVSLGIRWCVLCLLVTVPWTTRPWALPFMCVPVLSEKTAKRLKKPHHSCVWWTAYMVEKVREWFPEREVVLVGDGGFSAINLVASCQAAKVKLVTRLRLDAQLFEFPELKGWDKRGPKPKKGKRLPSLASLAADPKGIWCVTEIPWYGGQTKTVKYRTGVCLWYVVGHDPVPIRWVLVSYDEKNERTGKIKTHYAAFLCSDIDDPNITPEQILTWYVGRWNIEVTFEEVRAHLGLETQRHWSVRAVGRTTPCLFGLFSLVVLMAYCLYPKELPVRQSGWYAKDAATFSDVLAAVRCHLWDARNNSESLKNAQTHLIPADLWRQVQQILAYGS
jgi:hypothetical protein